MDYNWIETYCLEKKGTVKEIKPEWGSINYLIGGKLFGMEGTDSKGRPIFTVKLEPSHGDFLRQQFEGIIPGYYMNKIHWNSIYLENCVPENVIKDMIDESYELIFQSLPKKTQALIISK